MRGWLLLVLALVGCTGPDTFFVRSDGADLPVWVRGDLEAETWLLVQHGSGATGAIYDSFEAFDALEAEFAVVYWDQRGAGISQGQAAAGSMTVEQAVLDLDLVRAALVERHSPPRLALLGHSLGGGVSLDYLREPQRAEGIAAYVDVNGGRSLPESYRVVRERLLQAAETGIAEASTPEERAHFEAMRAFYVDTEQFPREEPGRSTHAGYVEATVEAEGFDYSGSTAAMTAYLQRHALERSFAGGFDVFAFATNTARFLAAFDLDGMDLSPEEVATVPVPTLVLAGRFDYSVPVEVSEATWESIVVGQPASRLVVLESSGHFPMWDEPEAFTGAVIDFVQGR